MVKVSVMEQQSREYADVAAKHLDASPSELALSFRVGARALLAEAEKLSQQPTGVEEPVVPLSALRALLRGEQP